MAKAARNRGAVKAESQRQVPGWVWLFSGVVTGLFIAFLVHLAQLQRENPPAKRESVAQKETQESSGKDQTADSKEGPEFDFYAVLPKMEMIVPEGEKGKADDRESSEQSDSRPDLSHRHDEHFLLQAGSFGQAEDADRRRAELTLKGYNVRIQEARMDDGRRFHRVMVGPFDNINALHDAQDKLANSGIDTLPIRKKSGDGEDTN
jgi:cell division protein FtsN